jgi:hypothetical protein
MKKILLFIGVLALTGVGILALREQSAVDTTPIACTADAKICPDGTAVGRTGPNCEFAACPTTGGTSQGVTTLSLHVGESGEAMDVTIIPLEIVEDSRCPIDVQCIWAGRIRVRVQLISGLGTSESIFELNTPITTEVEIVELVSVSPVSVSTSAIKPAEYTFTFTVAKR